MASGFTQTTVCPLWVGLGGEPLLINENECDGVAGAKCRRCGWNPDVEKERKRQIRELASQGRLREWGK